MLCKISNQFVERLDVLSFDDVRPLILFHEKYVLSDWNKANSSILSACHWYFFLLPERQSGGRGGGGAERNFITGAGTIREMGIIRGSIIICGAAVVCGSAIICSVGIVCSAAFVKWRDIQVAWQPSVAWNSSVARHLSCDCQEFIEMSVLTAWLREIPYFL